MDDNQPRTIWRLFPWPWPSKWRPGNWQQLAPSVVASLNKPISLGGPEPDWREPLERWLPGYRWPDAPDPKALASVLMDAPFHFRPTDLNADLPIYRVIELLETAGSQATDDQPSGTSRKERRIKWMAEAMLVVRDHPDWPDADIARKAGIDPSQLSRCQEYQRAAGIAREPPTRPPAGLLD